MGEWLSGYRAGLAVGRIEAFYRRKRQRVVAWVWILFMGGCVSAPCWQPEHHPSPAAVQAIASRLDSAMASIRDQRSAGILSDEQAGLLTVMQMRAATAAYLALSGVLR